MQRFLHLRVLGAGFVWALLLLLPLLMRKSVGRWPASLIRRPGLALTAAAIVLAFWGASLLIRETRDRRWVWGTLVLHLATFAVLVAFNGLRLAPLFVLISVVVATALTQDRLEALENESDAPESR